MCLKSLSITTPLKPPQQVWDVGKSHKLWSPSASSWDMHNVGYSDKFILNWNVHNTVKYAKKIKNLFELFKMHEIS